LFEGNKNVVSRLDNSFLRYFDGFGFARLCFGYQGILLGRQKRGTEEK
jgi:hypothetical protein